MGQNIAADDQAVAAVELKRYVTLRMARGIDNAQTGDDLVPRLDRFDLIFDCSVVAPRARDEAGAFRRQAARCVCACPEIPLCGRDVERGIGRHQFIQFVDGAPKVIGVPMREDHFGDPGLVDASRLKVIPEFSGSRHKAVA